MGEAASYRTVAVQLRSLSGDPDSQPIIAREEGCLRALVTFISGNDPEIARIAVAALRNLASHADNHELLRSEKDLCDALENLALSDAEKGVRQDALEILEEIVDEDNEDEIENLDELETRAGLKIPKDVGGDPDFSEVPVTARLRVPGISEEVYCMRVEQLVITKKGVVSVVFEIASEVAVVYTRLPVPQLAHYLSTMTGTKIDILPEEELKSVDENEFRHEHCEGIKGQWQNGTKNTMQPGYLDETGDCIHIMARTNVQKRTVSHGASSLHQRLRAQREEESRRNARSNRLLSSLGRGMRSGWGSW